MLIVMGSLGTLKISKKQSDYIQFFLSCNSSFILLNYTKAAEKGSAEGMYNVGCFYDGVFDRFYLCITNVERTGRCGPTDMKSATAWWHKAAAQVRM